MSDTEQNVLCWLDAAASFALPEWESLPSIPLYMDQVMMFARETLSLYAREENQSPLTSSMVNNYVKTGLVDHPDHKRYGKKQLARCFLTVRKIRRRFTILSCRCRTARSRKPRRS